MTSLPPENAPQLGTCELDGDLHRQFTEPPANACVNWKPVAAPENQPRPCPHPSHGKRLHFCTEGEAQGGVPQPCYDTEAELLARVEPGAHPPPDELPQEELEKIVDDRYRQFVQRHPHYHVTKAQRGDFWRQIAIGYARELQRIHEREMADARARARAPQPASSEKELSTWNTPATNAGPSRNLSNLCNAETTGTISAPSAPESSSLNQQSIEPPEFWHRWTQGASDPYTTTVSKATMFEFAKAYAREYASSSNAATEQAAEYWATRYGNAKITWESKIEVLEGQLREERTAHDKIGEYLLPLVGTGDGTSVSAAERAAKEVERLQEALRQVLCPHPKDRCRGGNDYLQCADCGLEWDWRFKSAPEVARDNAGKLVERAALGDPKV